MSETARKRPWVAALLAMLYPGLGHVYLRSWFRAVVWFGLVGSAVLVLVPAGAVEPGDGVAATLQAFWRGLAELRLRNQVLLVGIVLTEVVDAYVLALSDGGATANGCPSCGKELDEDLNFCPWCSEEL